jgi:hypothetical protein
MSLKLPHDGVLPEAMATWPGVMQRFAATTGVGRAVEPNKGEEPLDWAVAWPTSSTVGCARSRHLSRSRCGPARPRTTRSQRSRKKKAALQGSAAWHFEHRRRQPLTCA